MFSNNQLDKNHPIYKELVKILKWNGYVFKLLIFITILYLLYINHLSTTKTTNLDYILPNEQKCNKEGMHYQCINLIFSLQLVGHLRYLRKPRDQH